MPRSKARTPTRQRTQKRKSDPAMSVWEHLRILITSKKYEDALLLFEVLNVSKKNGQDRLPERLEDLETYYDVANTYFKTKRYAQAEYMLKLLIEFFPLPKQSNVESINVVSDFSEDAIRFTYHECLLRLRRHIDAYAVLSTVDVREYRPQVRLGIANVLEAVATKRKSKDDQESAKWDPPAFNEYGIQVCSSCIGSLTFVLINKYPTIQEQMNLPDSFIELFSGEERNDVEKWCLAHQQVKEGNVKKAIDYLASISHKNPRILLQMAQLNYTYGRKNEARRLLRIIPIKDPRWIDGMDMLAFLYSEDEERFGEDLEQLASHLMRYWPDRPETYVVIGFMSKQNDWVSSLQYAARAINCSTKGNIQYIYACLLKAMCLCKNNKQTEAVDFIRENLDCDTLHLELHRCLVDILIGLDEVQEAKVLVSELVIYQPDNIHAKLLNVHLIVHGRLKTRDPGILSELLRLMEDIMRKHPHVVGAILILISEFYKINQNEKCTQLMRLVSKHKKLMTIELQGLYNRIESQYYLRYHRPVAAYQYLVSAIALGANVTPSSLTELEVEFRVHGQSDLDRQLDSQASDETPPSPEGKKSKKSSCVYNLRSRQSTSLLLQCRPSTSSGTTRMVIRTPISYLRDMITGAVPTIAIRPAREEAEAQPEDVFVGGENENNARDPRLRNADEEDDDADDDDDDIGLQLGLAAAFFDDEPNPQEGQQEVQEEEEEEGGGDGEEEQVERMEEEGGDDEEEEPMDVNREEPNLEEEARE